MFFVKNETKDNLIINKTLEHIKWHYMKTFKHITKD